MTNRVTDYLPPEPPADGDDLAAKLRALRTLCVGVLLFELALLLMASGVVVLALGNRPVVKIGGTQALTGVGAVLTLTAVVVAVLLVPYLTKSGLRTVATTAAPPPEEGVPPDTPTDRLWRVYAQGKFAEYGLTTAAALVTAVLFHLAADWLMLGFVVGMVAFQVVRFPTEGRVRSWLTAAIGEVERVKGERGA